MKTEQFYNGMAEGTLKESAYAELKTIKELNGELYWQAINELMEFTRRHQSEIARQYNKEMAMIYIGDELERQGATNYDEEDLDDLYDYYEELHYNGEYDNEIVHNVVEEWLDEHQDEEAE